MTKLQELLACGFKPDASTDGKLDLYQSIRDESGAEKCGVRLVSEWASSDIVEITIYNNSGYEVLLGEISHD
jgi:hypothetical protein